MFADVFVRTGKLFVICATRSIHVPMIVSVNGKPMTEVALTDPEDPIRYWVAPVGPLRPTDLVVNGQTIPIQPREVLPYPADLGIAWLARQADLPQIVETLPAARAQGIGGFMVYLMCETGADTEIPDLGEGVLVERWPYADDAPAWRTMMRLTHFRDHTWFCMLEAGDRVVSTNQHRRVADELAGMIAQVVYMPVIRRGEPTATAAYWYSCRFHGFWGYAGPHTMCTMDSTKALKVERPPV
jgi:hypothetical protein